MLDWLAIEDGYVVTARMADWQVWKISQLFGCPALSYALEHFTKHTLDSRIKSRIEELHGESNHGQRLGG